jgi:glycosyltransferase involved in cell wall biosynthesis
MTDTPRPLDLTVLTTAYNSARWLESTLDAVRVALEKTSWTAEVIVVDDGSTDDTVDVLKRIAADYPHEIRVLPQQNQGVFIGVWNGLNAARAQRVLMLNSRLLVHEDALAYLDEAGALASEETWNGYVITDPEAPLVGHFWDVPLHIFWGSFLARPRRTEITLENFDRVPKGTGCLLVSRDRMLEAARLNWPEADARHTSDDTKLLRYLASTSPIILDPGFSSTYRPRVAVKPFLNHARDRGTKFVDSYAGTSGVRNVTLIGLLILPPAVLAAVIWAIIARRWDVVGGAFGVAAAAALIPAALAAVRGASSKAVRGFLTYLVPFGVAFWPGLARGILLHRRAFTRGQGAPASSTTHRAGPVGQS